MADRSIRHPLALAPARAFSSHPGNARVVQLTSGAPGPCFFLVPGTGGRIDGFVKLAPYLQVPIPVFAIEARGLDEASMPDTSVEDMARHYLTRIRIVQPVGPYFLLGHSFGGLVALEMAQLLAEAGERIACLILLDTPPPEKYWPFFFYLRNCGMKLHRHTKAVLTTSLKKNVKSYCRKLFLRGIDLNRMPTDVMIGSDVARVVLAHGIARESYCLKFYSDKVIFFRPLESPAGYETLWCNRVRDMEIFSAAGSHLGMVEPPHAPLLAVDLSECINKIIGGDAIATRPEIESVVPHPLCPTIP
jgi:thioesterase domain-containing protein